MAEILNVYTPEQITELMKNKVIADNIGLTNWNKGSRNLTLAEAVGLVESQTGMDYLEGLRKSIPVALYDGLDFSRKISVKSSGFLRFFRLPEFTIEYIGSGTACDLTITDLALTTTVTGAGGDDLNLLFSTYTTVTALVAAIDAHGSYNGTLVGSGASAPSALYNMASVDIVGETNYLNANGRDILLDPATAVILSSGLQASIEGVIFTTTTADSIPVGESTSPAIAAQCLITGLTGNIDASAIDTRNGKGVLNTPVTGVDYVINDSAFSGGQDEESEDDRALRFQTHVQGLSASSKTGIEAAVLKITEIRSVTMRENYPQRGTNTIIADDGTGTLSAALVDEIQKVLDGDPDDLDNYPGVLAAGITGNIEAPTVTAVDVTLAITRIGTLSDTSEIITAVQTAIENYINTLKLGRDVIVNEIRRRALNAHPAAYDISITTPTVNVSISDSNVARTGAGTGASVVVTVNTLSELP